MKLALRLKRELIVDIGSSHTVIASGHKSGTHRVASQATVAIDPAVLAARTRLGPNRQAQGSDSSQNGETKETETVMPVLRGKVVDVYAMELVLKRAMAQAVSPWARFGLRHVGALLAAPDLPEEERSRMRAILIDVGFSRMHIIDAPFAAARGGGLDIHQPQGRMLIDMGGGKTWFSVFTMGELAAWWQADFGGKDLDTAIVRYVAERYRRSISSSVAEEIKLNLGSVYPTSEPRTMGVTGYDLLSGEPKMLQLNDSEIRDVLVDSCEMLLLDFQKGFEDVAPELAGDIARYGVTLVGGGALLEGLPAFMAERTGLRFTADADPVNTTVRGAQGLLLNGSKRGRKSK